MAYPLPRFDPDPESAAYLLLALRQLLSDPAPLPPSPTAVPPNPPLPAFVDCVRYRFEFVSGTLLAHCRLRQYTVPWEDPYSVPYSRLLTKLVRSVADTPEELADDATRREDERREEELRYSPAGDDLINDEDLHLRHAVRLAGDHSAGPSPRAHRNATKPNAPARLATRHVIVGFVGVVPHSVGGVRLVGTPAEGYPIDTQIDVPLSPDSVPAWVDPGNPVYPLSLSAPVIPPLSLAFDPITNQTTPDHHVRHWRAYRHIRLSELLASAAVLSEPYDTFAATPITGGSVDDTPDPFEPGEDPYDELPEGGGGARVRKRKKHTYIPSWPPSYVTVIEVLRHRYGRDFDNIFNHSLYNEHLRSLRTYRRENYPNLKVGERLARLHDEADPESEYYNRPKTPVGKPRLAPRPAPRSEPLTPSPVPTPKGKGVYTRTVTPVSPHAVHKESLKAKEKPEKKPNAERPDPRPDPHEPKLFNPKHEPTEPTDEHFDWGVDPNA